MCTHKYTQHIRIHTHNLVYHKHIHTTHSNRHTKLHKKHPNKHKKTSKNTQRIRIFTELIQIHTAQPNTPTNTHNTSNTMNNLATISFDGSVFSYCRVQRVSRYYPDPGSEIRIQGAKSGSRERNPGGSGSAPGIPSSSARG